MKVKEGDSEYSSFIEQRYTVNCFLHNMNRIFLTEQLVDLLSLQSCSVEADPHVFEAKTGSGLVRGHAYSLTKVVKAKVDTGRKQGLFPLVRIRNPWGNDTEWKGAWSDGSMEWKFIPDDEKNNLGLTFDEDGEFYMSQKDFLQQVK